jgi:hypothetical protein
VSAHPHAPPVEQHASQITDVVGMQVGKEHGFQMGEAESGVGEPGRRPAAAVDDEDPLVDDER